MSISPWEKVCIARDPQRPTSLTYIQHLLTDFMELHGDRNYRDDPSVVGGIARLRDMPVTVIGIEKGSNVKDRVSRNFGSPHPEGYRKALRLMQQAEKFHRPVLCLVDTQGAYCGIGAEERGQGEAIARNLLAMMGLKTPVISLLIGEGGSGGALALAVADRVYMMEYAIYSILSPEGFASILWKDSTRAQEASEVMKLTAKDLFDMHVIDGVIKEPEGGVQKDVHSVMQLLDEVLYREFTQLNRLDTEELLALRYDKFRTIGAEVY